MYIWRLLNVCSSYYRGINKAIFPLCRYTNKSIQTMFRSGLVKSYYEPGEKIDFTAGTL